MVSWIKYSNCLFVMLSIVFVFESSVYSVDEGDDCAKMVTVVESISSVKITLADLAKATSENPIVKYPALAMTSAQKYHQLFTLAKSKRVLDPVYRAKKVNLYPQFTGSMDMLGTTSQKRIIGQYAAVETLANYIASLSRGEKGGKLFGVVGPSGTGKTELFYVLDAIRAKLSQTHPAFFEFTYEWKGLEKIPALKALVPTYGPDEYADSFLPDMQRSPFTLLRADIQESVLAEIGTEVSKNLGFDLVAWKEIADKDREIIELIMRKEYKKIRTREQSIDDLTTEEYLTALEKYVTVVPRVRVKGSNSDIIGYLGPNPNYSKLFVEADPVLSILYRNNPILPWRFNGEVLQKDGAALVFDEILRNEPDVVNTLLELAQNAIAKADGPQVMLDTIAMITGNDETFASAAQDGDINAFIDRLHSVPMRLNLHPHEISALAIFMIGEKNFLMRKLGVQNAKTEPLDLLKAYPLPTESGELKGLLRRYSIYYNAGGSDPILITPHTMEMLGLTATITRLVTDPKILKKFPEFDKLTPRHEYFVNPLSRIRLILGQSDVANPVRQELAKFSNLAHEGEKGISSRDIQSWFKTALDMAITAGRGVLSPEILNEAFLRVLNEGTIKVSNTNLRTEWLLQYRAIQNEFILPGLHEDLREIISGQGKRAEKMYDIVVQEFTALNVDNNAKYYDIDGNKSINKKRLEKIQEIYLELHNREFSVGFLTQHMMRAKEGEKNPELLRAVDKFITDSEMNLDLGVDDVLSYYRTGEARPETEKKVKQIETRLVEYGYDENSFKAALQYWSILKEKAKNK